MKESEYKEIDMNERLGLSSTPEAAAPRTKTLVTARAGHITVLEALAEESTAISPDMSRRSTQMGNGVDAEDD